MRRFFFTINDAVNLVVHALEKSKNYGGKILCANMKSCKLIDIIKVWNKKYGGSFNIIKGRKGDRLDEYLIGQNELEFTTIIYKNNKIYYLIDFEKKSKKPLKKIVSSKNAQKLNNKEILEIIDFRASLS